MYKNYIHIPIQKHFKDFQETMNLDKLIQNTVFTPISAPNAYLISRFSSYRFIKEWRLKEGGAYFKVKEWTALDFETLGLSFSKSK